MSDSICLLCLWATSLESRLIAGFCIERHVIPMVLLLSPLWRWSSLEFQVVISIWCRGNKWAHCCFRSGMLPSSAINLVISLLSWVLQPLHGLLFNGEVVPVFLSLLIPIYNWSWAFLKFVNPFICNLVIWLDILWIVDLDLGAHLRRMTQALFLVQVQMLYLMRAKMILQLISTFMYFCPLWCFRISISCSVPISLVNSFMFTLVC